MNFWLDLDRLYGLAWHDKGFLVLDIWIWGKSSVIRRIDRLWIVDLRVLHGLGGVESYYGTIPESEYV